MYENSNKRLQGIHLEKMIIKYIPDFKKTSNKEDKQGTDLIKNGRKYQVKCDKTIQRTGNLYYEIDEKSKPSENWRKSPSNANAYIFGYPVGDDFSEKIIVYFVLTKHIKEFIKKKGKHHIIEIPTNAPTSRGYLIPIHEIKHQKREFPIQKQKEKSTRPKPFF